MKLEQTDEPAEGEQLRLTLLEPDGAPRRDVPPIWDRTLRVTARVVYSEPGPSVPLGRIFGMEAVLHPSGGVAGIEVRFRRGRPETRAAVVAHALGGDPVEVADRLRDSDVPALSELAARALEGSRLVRLADPGNVVRPVGLEVWVPVAGGAWEYHTLTRVAVDDTDRDVDLDRWRWLARPNTRFLGPSPAPDSPWCWRRDYALPDDAPADVES